MKDTSNSIFNSKKTGIIMSVVSLVLIVCLLVVATYSWVETGRESEVDSSNNLCFDVSPDLDITGDNVKDGKITISEFELREVSSVDGRYVYVPDDSFYEITTGDGTKTDELRFREANPADVYDGVMENKPSNMRYVSFSFYISSPSGTNTPVYLSNDSGITGKGNEFVRMSIDTHDGNAPKVLSSSAIYGYDNQSPVNAVSSLESDYTAKTELQNYEAFATYAYIGEAKPLFTIEANKKKLITVTLWLEGASGDFPDTAENSIVGKAINAHINLKTNKDYVNTINVMDLTQETWVDDDNCYLFVFDADNYNPDIQPYENPSYKMSYNSSTYTWTTYIPQSVKNIYIQRYNPDDPNDGNWNTWGYGTNVLTIPGAEDLINNGTDAQKERGITRTYKIFGQYEHKTEGIKQYSAGVWDENPNLNHDKGMTYVYTFDATVEEWIDNYNGSTYIDYEYTTSYNETVHLRYKMSAQLNRYINRFWRITLPENMVKGKINFYRCAKNSGIYQLISNNTWIDQTYSPSSKFFALTGDTSCYRGTSPIYFYHKDSAETMGAWCFNSTTDLNKFLKLYKIESEPNSAGYTYHSTIIKDGFPSIRFAKFSANTPESSMSWTNYLNQAVDSVTIGANNCCEIDAIGSSVGQDDQSKYMFTLKSKNVTKLPNANETAYGYGK